MVFTQVLCESYSDTVSWSTLHQGFVALYGIHSHYARIVHLCFICLETVLTIPWQT